MNIRLTILLLALLAWGAGCPNDALEPLDPTPVPALVCPAVAVVEPGPALARRLTNQEYTNTVADVLGVDIGLEAGALPLESYVEGFRNTGWALSVSPRHVEQYARLAARVAGETGAVWTQGSEATFVASIGLRLFRRPPTSDEITRFARLFEVVYAEGEDFERGARLVVEAMLQSPQFLYRIESTKTDAPLPVTSLGQGSEELIDASRSHTIAATLASGDYRLRAQMRGVDDAAEVHLRVGERSITRWNVFAASAQTGYSSAFSISATEAGAQALVFEVEGAALGLGSVELVGPLPFAVVVDNDAPPFAVRAVGNFEMASRLSFFIWHSAPDETLLEAAGRGELKSDAQIAAQAQRLLADVRARRAFRDYVAEWLHLDELDTLERSADTFPEFGAALVADMKEETFRLFEDVVWAGHRDMMELFGARYTFASPALASLYDLAPKGSGFARYTFEADSPRAGLLTQASFLTLSNDNDQTSPTRRGLTVRNRFMCQSVPPPPSNAVMQAAPNTEGLSVRERFSAHSDSNQCAFCHRLMDPIGFGFEHFDAIGAYRTHDEHGRAIDASGQILSGGQGSAPQISEPFEGVVALARILSESAEVEQCMVEQVYQYALGRPITSFDGCQVQALTEQFRARGRSYQDLVVALVTSDAFRYVRSE
ncbi:MAG: DUF1592 domain-containing protein [Bradymonadaceae bacterium]|nr:DUF1592 domain-containing protein [Lujinxingiaceae bacterium]